MATSIKLPKAPDRYSERDQDHTRRLIEMAFAQYGFNISGVSRDVGDIGDAVAPLVPPAPSTFVPVSPIVCTAVGAPDGGTTAPALVQLRNPLNSGRLIWLWNIGINVQTSTQGIFYAITDTDPGVNTATVNAVTGTPFRLDENDVTSIVGVVRGGSRPGPFTAIGSTSWYGGFSVVADHQRSHSMGLWSESALLDLVPVILLPGQCLNISSASNNVQIDTRLMWDEFAI